MKPRQLLHAVGVQRFAGPVFTHAKGAIQSALEPRELRGLAHLARCDASQLGLTSTSMSDWLLVCDDWVIVCPRCIRANLHISTPPYERAVWRLAIPPTLHQWLTATEFLQVLQDFTTFAVERWHVDGFRTASSLQQQTRMLMQHGPNLFRCHALKRSWHLDSGRHVSLAHMSDPAIRRAVIWLAMEVILLPPSPRLQHYLRLRFTAQDDFFGIVKHESWEWLTHQAQAWPAPYRSHYWAAFTAAKSTTNFPIPLHDDTVKGTDDKVKGSE